MNVVYMYTGVGVLRTFTVHVLQSLNKEGILLVLASTRWMQKNTAKADRLHAKTEGKKLAAMAIQQAHDTNSRLKSENIRKQQHKAKWATSMGTNEDQHRFCQCLKSQETSKKNLLWYIGMSRHQRYDKQYATFLMQTLHEIK